MKLLYSKASPYSSKVRMAAHLCGFELDCVVTDTAAEGADLVENNPVGKIPTLVLDSGEALFDSRVICEYLDRASGNLLIPQTLEAWTRTKRVEALADGMTEAAIATLYEVRYRPEEKRHQPWVDKQWRRAHRALDALEREVAQLPAEPNLAHFAVASDLGWLQLRYPGSFETRNPALAVWFERFFADNPVYEPMRPQG
ncbi:glutathione S-transferase [Aureimonas pseudogalii]|uniref:Glutathione S-transferase n=1 Tax=Aureimonas pseudogalii TaxID=1744844 RepID=A0A7W6H4K8_9HYPH|nr:glutathione S-transferase [Aureimonas pseudogalii]MBB3998582.1 glutathione S-transferase [Aureimonas pseudogalii]